ADVTTLNKMLALAVKPGENATQGTLKADLAKVTAGATAAAVGEVPPWMATGAPFPMPRKIFAQAQRTSSGMEVRLHATLDGEKTAKKMAEMIDQAREGALAQLDKLQGQARAIPGVNLDSISALLKSVQLRTEANTLHLRLLAPTEAIMSIPAF